MNVFEARIIIFGMTDEAVGVGQYANKPDYQFKKLYDFTKFNCLKNKTQQELTPTAQEISLCAKQIQKINPKVKVSRIVQLLYQQLIADKRNKEQIQNALQQKIRQRQQRESLSKRTINFDHTEATKCIAPGEQYKFLQKQITAKALSERGPGLLAWKQQMKASKLKDRINDARYKSIIDTIGTEMYRKIQSIVQEQLKISCIKFSREEVRYSFSILTNCRDRLPKKESETYLSIVKASYGLQSSTIDQSSVISLFKAIQQALRLRLLQIKKQGKNHKVEVSNGRGLQGSKASGDSDQVFESNEYEQLQKIWNKQMEALLIELYHTEHSFVNIKQYFKEIYSNQANAFTTANLRSQLHKIIRASIRKIKTFLVENQIAHPFLKYTDTVLRNVVRSARYTSIRLSLLDIFAKEQLMRKEIMQVINKIANYLSEQCSTPRLTNEYGFKGQ